MVTMMPTGEEPPKGFEGYFNDKKARAAQGDLTINCVTLSQMAPGEIAELDELRTRALDNYCATTGNEVRRIPIEEELELAPSGSTPSDKLIFRAYQKGTLVAYAHVLCGWPKHNEWSSSCSTRHIASRASAPSSSVPSRTSPAPQRSARPPSCPCPAARVLSRSGATWAMRTRPTSLAAS